MIVVFSSSVCLRPSSKQQYNTGANRESYKPFCCGVQVSDRFSEQELKFEYSSKEASHGQSTGWCNHTIVFSFNSLSRRAETDERGNTRFIASNVCKIRGYINCRQSINAYRREDGVSKRYTIDRIGRRQETIAIKEVKL